MSLNTLGMIISVTIMGTLVCYMPKITGMARLVAFVVMLLAVVACLFFLSGVPTGASAL
jgi:type III secretory pathway component EscS